jgi:alcohol dehydrogenase class IV
MHFEFATATKIIFGPGSIAEAAPNARSLGNRALVVCGSNMNRAAQLFRQMEAQEVEVVPFQVSGEPDISLATEGVDLARRKSCDVVVGFGGGSVLDTGKAIAAMLTNPGDLMDYLEVIGRGQKINVQSAPYIAISTTAGTGAEVTQNAVLSSPEHRVKVSMRSPLMLPTLAIVDPELTYSMPPDITASTGLDALTQLIEAFVSTKSNPLTDGICREGIMRAARSLKRAFKNGNDEKARAGMSLASLFSGITLANAGLGAVHGLAGPIGGMFRAPHGVICARLLPYVMEANIRGLQAQTPESPFLIRYHEIAKIVTGNYSAHIEDGLEWIQRLCGTLKVLGLSNYGLTPQDFSSVVQKSRQASSMKGNPVTLSNEALAEILKKSL